LNIFEAPAHHKGDRLLVGRWKKRRVIALFAVWILLLLAVLSFLSLLEATFSALPDSHTIVSVSWAGYIVSSSFNHQRDITAVSGSWTVPTVNASAGDGYSSAWVGIGGQQDKALIQVGTEQNVVNGQAFYDAWYEMLPAYSVKIDGIIITPGDQISASITLANSDANQWNIQIADATTGQFFSQDFFYNASRSSGEWILERSTVNGQISNLADFGSVAFSNCRIGLSSDMGVIGNFTYSIVHMTNQQYDRLATTSLLGADGASFTVTYDMSA
jgi:hypothetical protein